MPQQFQRVAIVNRGEAAMRFIRAVREFNLERGTSLLAIALFTDPDRHAMFVREADESVYLGPAMLDAGTQSARSAYVDYTRLAHALGRARADAAWVGWGFVAEHADFADLCRESGITFLGPSGAAMRLLGDKISSKHVAEQARIPVTPWSGGPVETLEEARLHARRLGYPLLIKATAGGGGHGIRIVTSESDLAHALERARAEAFKAFGNSAVFLEKAVEEARHVEVQIIADHHGTTWAVGVRDCTLQRRQQKILEEAPSPALTEEQDRLLREAAVRLSQAAQYSSAGTAEFLYQPKSRQFWFMEMNTRLQVEHPVTECTTGVDLAKLQIHVALGGRLEGAPPRTVGHAIEVRLNAEDPDNKFAAAPGRIERFRIAGGPGVRIDTGISEGDVVPPEFDAMIAKIIGYGRNRKEALSRLQRTLRESVVVIRGGASNKAFLQGLLNRPEVQRGGFDVGWIDSLSGTGQHVSRRYADVALLAAAIHAYDADLAVEQAQFYASAVRGRPAVRSAAGRKVDLRYRGNTYTLQVYRLGTQEYAVEADGSRISAQIERLGQFEYRLSVLERRFHVVSVLQGVNYRIEVDGVGHRIEQHGGGVVRSLAPAVVVSVAVKPGDAVSAGDRLVVLEAMKMETEVVAPFSGKVRQVMTIPNVQVDTGTPLLEIEAADEKDAVAGADRVVLGESRDSSEEGCKIQLPRRQHLEELRQLMLGFDVDPGKAVQLLAANSLNRSERDEDCEAAEEEILNIFVDICALFQRVPTAGNTTGGETPSAEAHLFSYLRMLDTQGEGLPASFVDALRKALAHYGVRTLDRSPELEESLLWIYKSRRRVEQQIAPILRLLENYLARAAVLAPYAKQSLRIVLDRLISVTRGSYAAVRDMAREVRYRYFDQPLLERARQQIHAEAEDHLNYLAANPDRADRDDRVRQLVECPQPLMSLFADRFAAASPLMRQLILEVLTRRYYRIRNLENCRNTVIEGQSYVSAEYDRDGKRIHLFTTYADYPRLIDAARAVFPMLAEVPAEHDVALDFYIWQPGPWKDEDSTQREIQSMLAQAGFPRPIRRIVVAVGNPGRDRGMSGMRHFTYRPCGNAYEEEKLYQGLHPMLAKRIHLWRLSNFHIERLPSAEDIYLLHVVAKDNPKDERLFACAEVRDLTPVRDETGRIVELPHLERMLLQAFSEIRRFQSRRSERERLYWNRVFLYVWPPLYLNREEFYGIVHKLVSETEGLGLEQVVVRARIPNPETGQLREMAVRISSPCGRGLLITFRPATVQQPIKALTEYDQKVVRMRQRGLVYPYEIIRMLTPGQQDNGAGFSPGEFVEHDLDAEGRLVPVNRSYGQNQANIVVGILRNFTQKYPEGLSRVFVAGDPSKDLGALAEPECRLILAALDLAGERGLPLEWFALSAGAKISMDSGVENMDWIARVLRRLVEFTQAGGEVNIVINGVNVGAQPYWNAEATMLMHTRGILIMTPNASMVLTGKRALDYSGGVSAEDNQGIGGYDRIMGVNGQAQYWAEDLEDACHLLLRHYDHTYVAPGEHFPRRATTADPIDRDIRDYPHGQGSEDGFARVGDIFSDETNAGRKKSFDIRKVMAAVIDQDHRPLERWSGMRAAEIAVVWDAHLGGYPVCLLGIESRPLPRIGFVPADGPDQWCAGTLFPESSKKVARAINAASNNRPVVLLANLSGFDGSPESMRRLQLEYGAEIGRAVVNFKGPIVFCVISRYHGGAYVVFSRALNETLEVSALEGTYASVIGGAPAAAVVFAGEVESRTRKDQRLQALRQAMEQAAGVEKGRLRAQWDELFKLIHSEKLGEMAAEFDRVHSVQRALQVGAIHRIIPPAFLRPYLIEAVERGMKKTAQQEAQPPKAAVASVAPAA